MPDAAGLHHRWLFEYRGSQCPNDCVPIITGSDEEQAFFERLDEFLELLSLLPPRGDSALRLLRLRELRAYAAHREPCFPGDLPRRGFVP
jgi:hypothetical protein